MNEQAIYGLFPFPVAERVIHFWTLIKNEEQRKRKRPSTITFYNQTKRARQIISNRRYLGRTRSYRPVRSIIPNQYNLSLKRNYHTFRSGTVAL